MLKKKMMKKLDEGEIFSKKINGNKFRVMFYESDLNLTTITLMISIQMLCSMLRRSKGETFFFMLMNFS